MPAVYRPRDPRRTPLFRLLEALYEPVKLHWERRFEARYGFFRGFWDQAVACYLDCGIWDTGYAASAATRVVTRGWSPFPARSAASACAWSGPSLTGRRRSSYPRAIQKESRALKLRLRAPLILSAVAALIPATGGAQDYVLPDSPANRARGVVGCVQTATGIDCSRMVGLGQSSGDGLATATAIIGGLLPLVSSLFDKPEPPAPEPQVDFEEALERELRAIESRRAQAAERAAPAQPPTPTAPPAQSAERAQVDARGRVTARLTPLVQELRAVFEPLPADAAVVDLRFKDVEGSAAPALIGWQGGADLAALEAAHGSFGWAGVSSPALDASRPGATDALSGLGERLADKLVDWGTSKGLDRLPGAVQPFRKLYDEGREVYDLLSGHSRTLLTGAMDRASQVTLEVGSASTVGDSMTWEQLETWREDSAHAFQGDIEGKVMGKDRGLLATLLGGKEPPPPDAVLARAYRERWPF